MHRPTLIIALKTSASPLAHERDEDSLDRERDHGGGDEHDADYDVVREGIEAIVEAIHERGEPAIRAAWELGAAFKRMAKAAAAHDDAALEAAVRRACDAIREVSREGEDDGER